MFGLSVYLRLWRRSKPYDPRTGKRVGGIRRVIAYGLTVSLIVGLGAMKKAQADGAEAMKGLSRDLLALRDVLGDGKELRINGESVHAAVTPTTRSVKETLDDFERHCEENPGVLRRGWSELLSVPGVPKAVPVENGTVKMGTFRSGDDKEGIVLCIARGDGSPKDLATAFDEFSRTQDLGALGKMRYVYARSVPNGGAQVMTAWTDDHFSFNALAATNGDAPGSDSLVVPRLPSSQRILTAEVQGTSYAVRIYEVPGSVPQVLARYDTLMKERGFVPIKEDSRGERGYLLGGLFITMVAQPSDKGVTLSFAELGSNVAAETTR